MSTDDEEHTRILQETAGHGDGDRTWLRPDGQEETPDEGRTLMPPAAENQVDPAFTMQGQGTPPPPGEALHAGEVIHWYEIDKVLGQGGFGITYRARDTKLNTYVAIKEFLPNSLAHRAADATVQPKTVQDAEIFHHLKTRFLDEAQTLAKFRHPNLVRVMAFFERANTALIVMEYEEGDSLSDILQRKKTLPEQELLDIMLPLLDGVAALHRENFIHRDIKPGNVLIRHRDKNPVLLDFGSARNVDRGKDASSTMTSMFTPSYAPIEQYFDEASRQGPWTDIYALAAVMYHALTGQRPVPSIQRGGIFFGKDDDPLVPAHTAGAGRYSEATLRAIDWGLKVRESDRPQTIEEWLTAFEHVEVGRKRSVTPLPDRKVIGQPDPPAPTAAANSGKSGNESAKFLVLGLVVGFVLVFAGIGTGVWMLRTVGESKSEQAAAPAPAPQKVVITVAPSHAPAPEAPAPVVAPAVPPPPAQPLPPAKPDVADMVAAIQAQTPAKPVAPAVPPQEIQTALVKPEAVVSKPTLSSPKEPITLELSTSRGKVKPVYHKNEVIKLVTRVNAPAYVYLFDLDSEGNMVMLFPPPGSAAKPLEPGKELHLPGPNSPFDMVVQPPYGKDTIWAVASHKPLDLKVPADGVWSNGREMRQRLRGNILPNHEGHAESEVEIQTRP